MPSSVRSCARKVAITNLVSGFHSGLAEEHSLAEGFPSTTPPHLGDMNAWIGAWIGLSERNRRLVSIKSVGADVLL